MTVFELQARNLEEQVSLDWQTCFGQCQIGPNVLVRPIHPGEEYLLDGLVTSAKGRGVLYNGMRPTDAKRVIEEHLVGGEVVEELIRKTES